MEFQNLNLSAILTVIWLFFLLVLFWLLFHWSLSTLSGRFSYLYDYFSSILRYILLALCFSILFIWIFKPSFESNSNDETGKWIDIVFVLDVSKSMNVKDFEYEWRRISRLEASKIAIWKIVVDNPVNRYWLVVFAWEAISVSPLTFDWEIFLSFLSTVDYKNLKQQGSDIVSAYSKAYERVLEPEKSMIVLISDGGDEWFESELSTQQKIATYIYGIGTKNGWPIPTGTDPFGRTIYERFEWEEVIVWLNDDALRAFAKSREAEYENIRDFDDLGNLTNTIDNIEKKDIQIGSYQNQKTILRYLSIVSMIFFILYLMYPLVSSRINQIKK